MTVDQKKFNEFQGAIDSSPDRPEDEAKDKSPESIKFRRQVHQKQAAYRSRFSADFRPESGYLIPHYLCHEEAERAKNLLIKENEDAEVFTVPFDGIEDSVLGFEIDAFGRRFSIPRDGYWKHDRTYMHLEVDNMVVSILDKSHWPAELPIEVSEKTKQALEYLSEGRLIDEARDLAIFLQLGDAVFKQKKSYMKRVSIEKAIQKFDVEGEDQLKQILEAVGLTIIETSNRLIDQETREESGNNSKTEIDALIEAVNTSLARKNKKRRWLSAI